MPASEEKRFVDLIEKLMVRWGYTHTEGRIYGLLLVSKGPLSIADLVRLTGMSRTSISVSLSKLARDYLVTYTKNGKTKLYSPIPSFIDKFMELPNLLLEREVLPARELIEVILKSANDKSYRAKLKRVKEGLDELASLLEKIIKLEFRLKKQVHY